MVAYRIVSWNVDVTQTANDVHDHIEALTDTYKPDMFVGTETYKWASRFISHEPPIKVRIGEAFWHPHTGAGIGSERYDIALLSRTPWERRDTLPLKTRWRGPKAGKMHDPRQLYGGIVRKQRRPVKVLAVHGPFDERPVREFVAACRRWFLVSLARRPVVIVGDFNRNPRRLAQLLRIPGVRYAGRGVDGVLVRNCRIVGCRTLDNRHDSDHAPQVIDLDI